MATVLDFPHVGLVFGQKYPQPPVPGQPVYTWDGEKWITAGGDITGSPPATALPLMDATPAVVGTTVSYAREDHVHPVDTKAVRTEMAQSLSTTAQAQARSNIYVPPFDAMAYSGLQINGEMQVSQERGATPTSTSGQYPCDGYALSFSGTMVIASAADNSGYSWFPYHAKMLFAVTTTAQVALTAGNYTMIYQSIEGWRVARLAWGTANALPITISFWSNHFRPGLYSGAIRNVDSTRSYAFTYTQATSNVAQYNTITILGCTDGAWNKENGVGMSIDFCLACGTTLIAPSANTWLTGNYVAAPGQVNGVTSTSDVFRITGLTILPGTQAPTAAQSPNIMRPYDQELATCKRYFYNGVPVLNGGTSSGTADRMACRHPVAMRISPTVTITAALPIWDGALTGTMNSVNANYSTNTDLEIGGPLTGGPFTAGAGRMLKTYQGAGGNVNVDARL